MHTNRSLRSIRHGGRQPRLAGRDHACGRRAASAASASTPGPLPPPGREGPPPQGPLGAVALGTTGTEMPRAEPHYRSHSASRRPAAALGEAGSYLNPGSEENGGEKLSVGETGRRRRSWALAPFPGEWGLEGGSNEWREESCSSCSPAPSAGVGLGCGREVCPLPGKGAAWGWPWGAALIALSSPSPIWMCLPEGRRKGSADGLCVLSTRRAGDEGIPRAACKCLYLFLTIVTLALSVVRKRHSWGSGGRLVC